jgi:transposase-like protein
LEIITGIERRRRWRIEEKLRIVAESQQSGVTVGEVARRHEVSRGLVWTWRRQVRRGLLRSPDFLAVCVTDAPLVGDPTVAPPAATSRAAAPLDDRAEIVLADGTTIRTGPDVSLATLRRLMAALRG